MVPSHFDFAIGPFGNRSPAITRCHHARGSAAKRLDCLRRVTASTHCTHAAALFSFGLELPSERQLLASRMPAVEVENTITP